MTRLDWALLGGTIVVGTLVGTLAGALYGLWQLNRFDCCGDEDELATFRGFGPSAVGVKP